MLKTTAVFVWPLILKAHKLWTRFDIQARTQQPKGDIVKPSPQLQYYWQHYNPLGSRSEQGRPEGPILWVLKVIYNPLFLPLPIYSLLKKFENLKAQWGISTILDKALSPIRLYYWSVMSEGG